MTRFIFFILVGGLALAAILAVNIGIARAGEETKVIPISVLAEDQADYSVDKDIKIIPAVSPDIIEDKIHDLQPGQSTLPVLTYTPLKSAEPAAVQPEDEEAEIYIYRGEAVDKEEEKQEKQEQKESEQQEKQDAKEDKQSTRENTKKDKQNTGENKQAKENQQDTGEDLNVKETNADKK
jgi:outer membrane biosynthesis protein TonB